LVLVAEDVHDLLKELEAVGLQPVEVDLEVLAAGHALGDSEEDVHVPHQL
jgi:hypothetical protein